MDVQTTGATGGSGGEGEKEVLPLQLRRHGFDVYWNGRLIPAANFERYSFIYILLYLL